MVDCIIALCALPFFVDSVVCAQVELPCEQKNIKISKVIFFIKVLFLVKTNLHKKKSFPY
jgi:hypothetical protein